MKAIINVARKEFLKGLDIVFSAVDTRNSLPVLDYALMQVKGKEIDLHAMSLGRGIEMNVKINIADNIAETMEIEQNMKILQCLIPKEVHKLLQTMNADIVSIIVIEETRVENDKETKTNRIEIKELGKTGDFKFQTLDAQEFPEIKTDIKSSQKVDLMYRQFVDAMERASRHITEDDLKPMLNHVFVHTSDKDQFLRFVSTDSHKMGITKFSYAKSEEISMVIPFRITSLMKKLPVDDERSCVIAIDKKNVMVKIENYTIICRREEGNYPNYLSVLPKGYDVLIQASTKDMVSSIKQISLCNDVQAGFLFNAQENTCTLKASDSVYGKEGLSVFPINVVKNICGENVFAFGFNISKILDLLQAIPGENVSIALTKKSGDSYTMCVLTGKNDDCEQVSLLMGICVAQ